MCSAPFVQCANPEAAERIQRLHAAIQQAKLEIADAQERQRKYADQHRRDLTFQVGDSVLLSTEHLKLVDSHRRTPKLAEKFIGPFKVKRVVGRNAYELDLPPTLKIHPVLNISRLRAYRDGAEVNPHRPLPHARPPPESVQEDGAEVYEVEQILSSRGSGARARFLVKWKGYPDVGGHLGTSLSAEASQRGAGGVRSFTPVSNLLFKINKENK